MVVDIMIRRFSRHNQQFQAYLELMEAAGQQILQSEDPIVTFGRYQPLLQKFLVFLENEELQHEKEEEKLVFPVVEERKTTPGETSSSTRDLKRDHLRGRRLIRSLKGRYLRLSKVANVQNQDYSDFARSLIELTVHYHRHLAMEQKKICPVLTRILAEDDEKVFLERSFLSNPPHPGLAEV